MDEDVLGPLVVVGDQVGRPGPEGDEPAVGGDRRGVHHAVVREGIGRTEQRPHGAGVAVPDYDHVGTVSGGLDVAGPGDRATVPGHDRPAGAHLPAVRRRHRGDRGELIRRRGRRRQADRHAVVEDRRVRDRERCDRAPPQVGVRGRGRGHEAVLAGLGRAEAEGAVRQDAAVHGRARGWQEPGGRSWRGRAVGGEDLAAHVGGPEDQVVRDRLRCRDGLVDVEVLDGGSRPVGEEPDGAGRHVHHEPAPVVDWDQRRSEVRRPVEGVDVRPGNRSPGRGAHHAPDDRLPEPGVLHQRRRRGVRVRDAEGDPRAARPVGGCRRGQPLLIVGGDRVRLEAVAAGRQHEAEVAVSAGGRLAARDRVAGGRGHDDAGTTDAEAAVGAEDGASHVGSHQPEVLAGPGLPGCRQGEVMGGGRVEVDVREGRGRRQPVGGGIGERQPVAAVVVGAHGHVRCAAAGRLHLAPVDRCAVGSRHRPADIAHHQCEVLGRRLVGDGDARRRLGQPLGVVPRRHHHDVVAAGRHVHRVRAVGLGHRAHGRGGVGSPRDIDLDGRAGHRFRARAGHGPGDPGAGRHGKPGRRGRGRSQQRGPAGEDDRQRDEADQPARQELCGRGR